MNLPDIYANVPIDLVPAHTIATFPVNTFLENLATTPSGNILITSHEAGEIIRLDRSHTPTPYAKLNGKVAGIAWIADSPPADDAVVVNGWNAEGVPFVATLANGVVQHLHLLPEAVFLNGITPLSPHQYLMADSYRGAIWIFDLAANTTTIWLEHPLLARSDANNPFPAANGLKRFGNHLYVSNTQRMLLLRIPLSASQEPQEPDVYVEGTNVDDFAFDQQGNLYATTHVYNSVIRIDPNRQTTIIAQAEQGMTGSTAVAFQGSDLYVVTNGGMSLPPATGVEPAQVVCLAVGIPGAPLLAEG